MTFHKELYIGDSIEELDRLAAKTQDFKRIKKFDNLCRSANLLFNQIFSDPQDQERTYIYIVRYMALYQHMLNTIDDKDFVRSRFDKDTHKAHLQLGELRKSLINRYNTLKKQHDNKTTMVESAVIGDDKSVTKVKEPIFKNGMFVTCRQVVEAFNSKRNMLIMDARSKEDYKASNLKNMEHINVPADIIRSGLSAHLLGLSIPEEAKAKWEKRGSYEIIILMDWNVTPETYSTSNLKRLRTILLEWDLNTSYNEQPVVVNGGYLEFLQTYPTYCTNPSVVYNVANRELDEILMLDDIEYPTEGEPTAAFRITTIEPVKPVDKEPEPASEVATETREKILEEEKLITLKKQQVEKELLEAETQWKNLYSSLANEENKSKQEALESQEKAVSTAIQDLEEQQNELNDKKYELAKKYALYADFMPGKQECQKDLVKLKEIQRLEKLSEQNHKVLTEMAAERQRLLEYARSRKPQLNGAPTVDRETKPVLKPTVDRQTKPVYKMDPRDLGWLSIKAVGDGLVGLKNIRNTCYMSSAIQCLRHIPDLMSLFCSGAYATKITRQPDVITKEFAFLVRQMWTYTGKSIRPEQFYQAVCNVNASYRKGNHEDCMEFFLFLFNQLSDDCATDVDPAGGVLTPMQRAWLEQLQGKRSFFIDLFYHQIRNVYTCRGCGKKTVKFETENTLMLPLNGEQERFDLDALTDEYLRGNGANLHLVCSACKTEVANARAVSIQPKVLVIVLKRYIQEVRNNSVSFRKNEAPGFFKVDNLKFGKYHYQLSSVVMHSGTLTSGHYTAACFNTVVNDWYEYNDEEVRPIDITSPAVKTKACAFFYIRKNE